MDIVLVIVGIALVGAMFMIVGQIMYEPDRAGLRGILRAWGDRDRDIDAGSASDRHDEQ